MPQTKDSSSQLVIIATILLVTMLLGWFALNKWNTGDPVQQEIVASPTVGNQTVAAQTDGELLQVNTALQLGQIAYDSGQLVEPTGASALYFYEQVLQQEPDNAPALEGLSNITQQLVAQANTVITDRNYARTGELLVWLNTISAGSEEVLALEDRLNQLIEALYEVQKQAVQQRNFDRAIQVTGTIEAIPGADLERASNTRIQIAQSRADNEAAVQVLREQRLAEQLISDEQATLAAEESEPASEANSEGDTGSDDADSIAELLNSAGTRVQTNQIFTPANDSAVHFFNEVLAVDSANSDASRGLQQIAQAVIDDALDSAESGDWGDAKNALAPLENIDSAEDLLATARSQIRELRISEARQNIVSINEFEHERTVTPKYPERAQSRGIEGEVVLSFVVTATGATTDIKVEQASRRMAKSFSGSAIAAVSQWQFKPMMLDGDPIAQRTQTTVRFKVEE